MISVKRVHHKLQQDTRQNPGTLKNDSPKQEVLLSKGQAPPIFYVFWVGHTNFPGRGTPMRKGQGCLLPWAGLETNFPAC